MSPKVIYSAELYLLVRTEDISGLCCDEMQTFCLLESGSKQLIKKQPVIWRSPGLFEIMRKRWYHQHKK